ncbi:MAG: cysteine desulfurase [Acidobacteria bacterium]|nr:cysteine desulfurase [Acidobacteriota bacterium]
MNRTYLDHNASAPMPDRVRQTLADALDRFAGNASSPHAEGQAAKRALEISRNGIAAFCGARPSEVVLTSGGSESNNAAIRGAAAASRDLGRPMRLVTSAVEHPSVLETCRALEKAGFEWTALRVDARGVVDPDDLRATLAARPACLVSVMHANNETGVIQPVEALADVARRHGALFHVDAVQSAGKIPVHTVVASADFTSLASHKIGGPAGVGALVVRESAPFASTLTGGAHEGRRRAGTEPVPLAVAFAAAAEIAAQDLEARAVRLASLRDFVEEAVSVVEPRAVFHGRGAARLPNTTNFYIPGDAGRDLVMQLDLMGFAVSNGAACSTGSARPSHVLAAMGRGAEETAHSLRVSLGPEVSRDDLAGFLTALARALGSVAPELATEGAGR